MNVFSHSGSLGDIIYSLPTIKAMGGGVLLINKAKHYQPLKRLLELQPYINEVRLAQGREISISLDDYRRVYANNPTWHLAKCHLEALNQSFDLASIWLRGILPHKVADIIVHRTDRYHDANEIVWSMLKGYDVAFIGTDAEYASFIQVSGFTPKRHICSDILDMARAIKGSKIFFGNQSIGFAIAEAMKHPRVLEVCKAVDNCRPHTVSGYTQIPKQVLDGYIYTPTKSPPWTIVDKLAEVVLSNVQGCIVEIGLGASTYMLSQHAIGFNRRHYACDFSGGKWEHFKKLGLVHEYMHKFHCRSTTFMKTFRDKPAVVFIDGNHKYKVVSLEAKFFLDRLVPGGMAFFHDMYIPNTSYERYEKKGKDYDTYKCRLDIEQRDDVYTMSFPYTAANHGMTVVLKKERERPFYRL